MFRKQPRSNRGAWHINTAQFLIFLIAIGCGYVVYHAYQQSHAPPPSLTLPAASSKQDPKQVRYAKQVKTWQAKMVQQQMTVTWPYLGQDNVARIDLPAKVPITLADWDTKGQAKAAVEAYFGFASARFRAHVANPGACIVHVFSADGEEVAQASASGVVTSADQSLGSG